MQDQSFQHLVCKGMLLLSDDGSMNIVSLYSNGNPKARLRSEKQLLLMSELLGDKYKQYIRFRTAASTQIQAAGVTAGVSLCTLLLSGSFTLDLSPFWLLPQQLWGWGFVKRL